MFGNVQPVRVLHPLQVETRGPMEMQPVYTEWLQSPPSLGPILKCAESR